MVLKHLIIVWFVPCLIPFKSVLCFILLQWMKCIAKFQFIGAVSYVQRLFIIMRTVAELTLVLMPLAIPLLSFIRPCMPPLISSMAFLPCKSWNDHGNAGILTKLCISIFEWYTWAMGVGVVVFAIFVLFVYPIEVILLVLKTLEQ